ncbi:MAG TPA: zf-HC2 domain-containing protein, partial [Pirellulales bacterium]|nr:zf-HC2 domain-containing protein [Pirellulales bacterium]
MNPIPDDDPISDGDPIPDGELLSAYLDGELPADQRARVERLLAERPESRQLLDELRALRGTLEAVPRYRLEDDFAARVLRAAERAMLSGDALFLGQTGPSAPVAGDAHAEGDAAEANGHSREAGKPVPASSQEATWSSREPGWSWQRARRPMLWSCLALAAALLIMLVQPDGPAARREREVALGRRNAEMDAAKRDEVSLRKVPSPGADQGVESAIRDAELQDLGAEHQDEKRQDETRRGEEPAATPGLSSQPSAPATASQSPGVLGGGASAGNKARAPSEPSRGAGGVPGRGARMADPKKGEPIESDARRNSAVDAVQALDDDPTAANTLLIVCDVASDLVDSPELQQLLAKHDIILEQESDEAPKGVKEETAPLRGDVAGESSEEKVNDTYADRALGTFLKRRRAFGDAQGEGRDSVFEALDDALQVGEAEGLLVEATESQLEAVVADFERQSELFLSVAVHPAPDVPEQ